MGSRLRTVPSETNRNSPKQKMAYTYSSYSGYPSALQDRFPTIDVITDGYRRNCRAKSEMTEIMMDSLKTERGRFYREFLNDKPNGSGFYYPRYESNWSLEHGSPHIPYLARPYLNYNVNTTANRFTSLSKKKCV